MKNIFLRSKSSTFLYSALLVFMSFFMSKSLCAQSTFSEGYVVTNKGDSIQGYVNAKDKKIYSVCLFKQTSDAEPTKYTPDQLTGFRISDGKYFQSRVIIVDDVEKRVFLEYLVKGQANIFYYRDGNDHYYIETETVDLLELTSANITVAGDYGSYEMPKRHKSKLKAVMADSEVAQSKIETVSLNHRSLTNLAVSYHYDVCDTEDCIVFERKETKLRWHFSGFLGYGNYQIDLGSELKANTSGSPTFGVRVEMSNFLPWSNRVSVGLDLSFQNYTTESFSILYDEQIRFSLDGEDFVLINNRFYENSTDEMQADLDMTVMKLPISLLYNFGDEKVKPFLGIGFMNQIVLSQNTDFLYDRFVDVFGKTVPTYQMGVVASLGSKFFINANKAILLEFNYEYTSNLNINKSLKLKNSLYGLKLGFQFR